MYIYIYVYLLRGIITMIKQRWDEEPRARARHSNCYVRYIRTIKEIALTLYISGYTYIYSYALSTLCMCMYSIVFDVVWVGNFRLTNTMREISHELLTEMRLCERSVRLIVWLFFSCLLNYFFFFLLLLFIVLFIFALSICLSIHQPLFLFI